MIKNLIVQKAVIRHRDGTYLWLRRSSTDVVRPLDSDLPGGMLDSGETLSDGMLREIKEEINVQADNIVLRYTTCRVIDNEGEKKNYIQLIYTATVDTKDIQLSYEHDEYEWLDESEFKKRFKHLERYTLAINHIIDNDLVV